MSCCVLAVQPARIHAARASRTFGCLGLLLTLGASAQAQTRVVTFELPAGTTLAQLRAGLFTTYTYGLRLDPGASAWGVGQFGTKYPCPSGTYCASPNGVVSGDATFGTFTFERASLFQSFLFSGEPSLSAPGSQARIAVQLSLGGVTVYTSPFMDVLRTTQQFTLAYAGRVDAVRFVGNPSNALFDDITFTPTAVVPEPSTVVLTAGGLSLVAALAWRRGGRRATV